MANGNNWNKKTGMYDAIEDDKKFKNNVVLGSVSYCLCSNQLPRKTGVSEHTCMNCTKLIK